LVIVAIIQIKNLKIEAEKGFRRTLFDPELVDPNLEINFVNNTGVRGGKRKVFGFFWFLFFTMTTLVLSFKRKGNSLNYTTNTCVEGIGGNT